MPTFHKHQERFECKVHWSFKEIGQKYQSYGFKMSSPILSCFLGQLQQISKFHESGAWNHNSPARTLYVISQYPTRLKQRNQYHGYWWLGDTRIQGISSKGFDLFCPEYSMPYTYGFITCDLVSIGCQLPGHILAIGIVVGASPRLHIDCLCPCKKWSIFTVQILLHSLPH